MPEVETVAKPKVKPGFNTIYGTRFRKARLAAKFTLTQAAEAAGVSPQAISQFERGAQQLHTDPLVKAIVAMNASLKYILLGQGGIFGYYDEPGREGWKPEKRVKKPAVEADELYAANWMWAL